MHLCPLSEALRFQERRQDGRTSSESCYRHIPIFVGMFSWQDHGKPWNSASVQCLTKSIDVDVLRIQIALILLGENDIRLIRCSCPSARILEEPLMHIFGSQNHYIEQPCKSWRVDGVCLRSGFTFHNARNTETHFGLCMATGAHSGPFLSTYRFSLYRCRLLRQTHALFCYVFIVYIIYNTPICRTPASPQKETCVQAIFFVRIICNIYIYMRFRTPNCCTPRSLGRVRVSLRSMASLSRLPQAALSCPPPCFSRWP